MLRRMAKDSERKVDMGRRSEYPHLTKGADDCKHESC